MSEILYVKGQTASDSENEDIWDDRKLNSAYDKAALLANEEVAKRLAMSTNNPLDDKEGFRRNKKKQFQRGNARIKDIKWRLGMSCRAVYCEDGQEYEATIMKIVDDKDCIVTFLGYDNSETVPISSLKPSLGVDERAKQITLALEDEDDDADFANQLNADIADHTAASPEAAEKSYQKKKEKKQSKKGKTSNHKMSNGYLPEMPLPIPDMSSMLRNLEPMDMPLPPPPPPPTLPPRRSADSEEQAVSSMLLSWYMSGYYTGLYQGLKRAKENYRN